MTHLSSFLHTLWDVDQDLFLGTSYFSINLSLNLCQKLIYYTCVGLFLDCVFFSSDISAYPFESILLPWLL